MSNVWKLKLFKKLSSTEALCEKCDPPVLIKIMDGSTKLLRKHIEIHPEEAGLFKNFEQGIPTQKIDSFVIITKKNGSSILLGRRLAHLLQGDQEVGEGADGLDHVLVVYVEIIAHMKLNRLSPDLDPTEYWKDNHKAFPTLAKLAMKYLSAPATSVASD